LNCKVCHFQDGFCAIYKQPILWYVHLLELIYSLSLSLTPKFCFQCIWISTRFFVQFQMIQGFQVLVRAARGCLLITQLFFQMIQSFLLGNVKKCLLKVSKSASSKHHFLLCALQICRCISILFIIGVQVHVCLAKL